MAQTKDSQIQVLFWNLVDSGYTDKQKIYSTICEQTGFSRPHVRRACGELRNRISLVLSILNQTQKNHVNPRRVKAVAH